MQDHDITGPQTSNAGNAPETARGFSIISPDWLLEDLVGFANHGGLRMSISINVPGGIVSGTLIPVTQYFDEFVDQFKAGFKGDVGQIYFDQLSGYKPSEEELSEHRPLPQYIHLKDAKLYSPGTTGGHVTAPLWRGRINEIAGFFLSVPSD